MNPAFFNVPLSALRAAYGRGENIMELLRSNADSAENSISAVLAAYDLQAGSYRRHLSDPGYWDRKDHNTTLIARILDELGGNSLLDAGVGEATTLAPVLQKLGNRYSRVAGLDLSWSRLAHAKQHLKEHDLSGVHLVAADLFRMPFASGSFDVVFTSHALEPNHGREREALEELARVARQWIVLFEPSYERGSPETREAIVRKGYVRGLADAARAAGLAVSRDELAGFICSPGNETGMLLLKKGANSPGSEAPSDWIICPSCQGALALVKGHYFCQGEGLVFPILDDLPCLVRENAILATQFETLDPV